MGRKFDTKRDLAKCCNLRRVINKGVRTGRRMRFEKDDDDDEEEEEEEEEEEG
jgi:hypothetical protein